MSSVCRTIEYRALAGKDVMRAYSVIALDPSGSGETVSYLPCITTYSSRTLTALSISRPTRKAPKDLNRIFNQIANPLDDWPQTTRPSKVGE